MYIGGVWFVLNIKSVHGGVLLLCGSVLFALMWVCLMYIWVWFRYIPLIFAKGVHKMDPYCHMGLRYKRETHITI